MAENMTGMLVENTMVGEVAGKRSRAHWQRIGAYGLVATLLVALLITGVAMHDRQASHSTAPAIPYSVTMQRARFLENNTTNLPNAVTAEARPVVTSSQQRFLETNTITLPDAAPMNAISPITTQAQQRFLEVNTMLPDGPSYPNAENLTSLPGHPR